MATSDDCGQTAQRPGFQTQPHKKHGHILSRKRKRSTATSTPRAYPSASQLRQTTRYLSTRPNRNVTRRGAWRRHHRRPPPPARGPTPPPPPFPPPTRAIISDFAARIALGLSPSLSSKVKHAPSPEAHAHRAPSSALKAQVDAVNIEEAKQAQGASTGPRYYDKDLLPSFSPKELLEKLKRYGAAGVLSYGLLNTVYYVTTFLLVWFHFSPAPGRMGYAAAVERFIKLMAMVWAGSQVTKVLRAGGALALAPFVDKGLTWFTVKFNFQSEGKAFATIVGLCFGLAALLFFGLTVLWA